MRDKPEGLEERDARTQIKKLKIKNTALTVNKTRKKIKVNSNEKLASFKNILNTQTTQNLEAVEEEKRAERRRKRAKKELLYFPAYIQTFFEFLSNLVGLQLMMYSVF